MGFADKFGEEALDDVIKFLKRKGTNIVTCPNCGKAFGTQFIGMDKPIPEIECPFCKTVCNLDECPDFFY